jgi:hypothetical protein
MSFTYPGIAGKVSEVHHLGDHAFQWFGVTGSYDELCHLSCACAYQSKNEDTFVRKGIEAVRFIEAPI